SPEATKVSVNPEGKVTGVVRSSSCSSTGRNPRAAGRLGATFFHAFRNIRRLLNAKDRDTDGPPLTTSRACPVGGRRTTRRPERPASRSLRGIQDRDAGDSAQLKWARRRLPRPSRRGVRGSSELVDRRANPRTGEWTAAGPGAGRLF